MSTARALSALEPACGAEFQVYLGVETADGNGTGGSVWWMVQRNGLWDGVSHAISVNDVNSQA